MRRADTLLLLALVVAGIAAWPLLSGEGLLNTRGGGDSPFLLQRLHQLETAVRDGHFPVRWMPDSNYGYGYPFFNYYAPLAYYIALFFRLLGFSLVRAIQLSQLAAFLTAAWGSYRLGQRWWGNDTAALLSSAAYTLAPFHLVNVYVRGDSIAEFWAMAFFPLVFLAIVKQGRGAEEQRSGGEREQESEGVRDSALSTQHSALSTQHSVLSTQHSVLSTQHSVLSTFPLALAYAGLLLSHNISALIFSPFALLAGLMVVWQSKGARLATLGRLAVGALLGLALSAWFWWPALAEQGFTQLDGITADYFHYSRHFRPLGELTQTSLLFSYETNTLQAFRMGLVQAILLGLGVLGGLWSIVRRREGAGWAAVALLGTAAATLMMMPLSQPVWDALPLIAFTQFPWRFLSIQAFFGAMLIGRVASGEWLVASGKWSWVRRFLPAGVIVGLLITSLGGLRPDYLPIVDEAVTAEAIAQYEWFTGNIGTTINHEYLTPAVQPRPVSSAWLNTGERWTAQETAGTADATLMNQHTHHQTWQVRVATTEATLTLPLMFWPGWEATAAGQPIELTAARGSGLATFTLPEGSHTLILNLRRTSTRLAAELISLLAILGMGAYGAVWFWRQPKRDLHHYISPLAFDFLIFSLLALVALGWWEGRQTLPVPVAISQDFGEMGYLHPTAEGIFFTNGAHLVRYETSGNQAYASETWHITLFWGALPEGERPQVTVALTTPATYFYNDVPPLAQATAELTSGTTAMTITVPTNAARGLYFPQILWEDGNVRPLTPAGRPRAPLSLPPVQVVERSRLVMGLPRIALEVRPVQASQRTPTVLDITVAWFTARPLGESYKTSWRLTSETGIPFHQAQFDSQPGYGYWPTVAWPAGEWVQDRVALALPLPEERPFPPPYVQTVTLYDHASQEVILTRRLGVWLADAAGVLRFAAHQPNFSLPTGLTPAEATFVSETGEPLIALRGYTRAETADGIAITLYWEALQGGMADYHHFVHLLDPATHQPLAQHDGMPRHNTYPTSQWVVGEIVADELFLPLADVPAGEFALVAGLYEVVGESYPRLGVLGGGDTAVGLGTVLK